MKGSEVLFRGKAWSGKMVGLRLDSQANHSGQRFYFQHRLFTNKGWTYQLIAWGAARDEETVARAANDLVWRFEILDYEREASSETNSPTGNQDLRETKAP
jgi:hypothetical protein